jgi:hypothetical protein
MLPMPQSDLTVFRAGLSHKTEASKCSAAASMRDPGMPQLTPSFFCRLEDEVVY